MRYTCDNMRPVRTGEIYGDVEVSDIKDAARVFADRFARKEYGRRRGYCHLVRADSWAADGRYTNFEVFIGTRASGGWTSGRNIWLSVYVEED